MKKIIVLIYVILTGLFLYFDFVNFKPHTADTFKYGVVVLSFLTAAVFVRTAADRRDGFLLAAALLVTVITDYFLVLADWVRIPVITEFFTRFSNRQVLGMACYGIVMTIYFLRYQSLKRAAFIPFFLIIPLILNFYLRMEPLAVVCSYYVQMLAATVVSAMACVKKGKYFKTNALLILLGMFIFMFGDVAVVLTNFFAIQIFRKVIWIFYAPSLALLSFSGFNYEKTFLKS